MKKIALNTKLFKVIFSMTILTCIMMSVLFVNVSAASFNISGPSSVEPNANFTVSFGSGTVGAYSYSVSGGSIVSSPGSWVEGGGSLTVKAGASGTVTVSVTANTVTTSSYEDIPAGTTRSVSVSIAAAETTTPTTPTIPTTPTTPKPTDTRSSNNNLNSLSIKDVEISPAFSYNVTEYTAKVLDIDEITISANVSDNKSKLSGTGVKTLNVGENVFKVVVTAENGNNKTYTITVTKEEAPTVFMDFNGTNLGIVKNTNDTECFTSFDKCIVEVNGEEAVGWYSTPLDMTLFLMVDENNNRGFYAYGNEQLNAKVQSVTINSGNYLVTTPRTEQQEKTGYVFDKIKIGEEEVPAWTFSSEEFGDYKIIDVINEKGEEQSFLYSISDDTFIISPNFAPVEESEYEQLHSDIEKLESENKDLKEKVSQANDDLEEKNSGISKIEGQAKNLIVLVFIPWILLIALLVIYNWKPELLKFKK